MSLHQQEGGKTPEMGNICILELLVVFVVCLAVPFDDETLGLAVARLPIIGAFTIRYDPGGI